MLTRVLNRLLRPAGLRVTPAAPSSDAEGFDDYVRRATDASLDVNDWLEREQGWTPSLPVLERVLFPHIGPQSIVCEVGPATGRQSRHIAPRVSRLYLADTSVWSVGFLKDYFRDSPHVTAHLSDGLTLPFLADASLDCVFSGGTFIALKLGQIRLYCAEFARVLKPGGVAVFNYLDPESEGGWEFLETRPVSLASCFTYHTPETIDRALRGVGLAAAAHADAGSSKYVLARRPA
jgi:SAM-dependent methyltransferase